MTTYGPRAANRLAQGPIFRYLATWVGADETVKVERLGYEQQVMYTSALLHKGRDRAAAALSMLSCEYPVQMPVSDVSLSDLVINGFGIRTGLADLCSKLNISPMSTRGGAKSYEYPHRAKVAVERGAERVSTGAARAIHTPIKSVPGASNKVNVYLSEILTVLRNKFEPVYYDVIGLIGYLPSGALYDDQWSAVAMYAALSGLSRGAEVAVAAVLDPAMAKELSTVLKGLGANAGWLGSQLVELQTLAGRGVNPVDLGAESRYRCDPAAVAASTARFEPERLRSIVRAILAEELGDADVEFATLDDHWSKRWLWCVNGSHARLLERLHPRYKVEEIPGVTQWYRRMFAEATQVEPISGWNGQVFVSASPKLEHGKVRAIFACDSVSYFAFEHMLSPVEARWSGKRVILSPGDSGHYGMAKRVLEARGRGAFNLMLDYDDFNSQHTLLSQQIVIEEVCRFTNYPEPLARNLVASFSKMEIHLGGQHVGRAAGTLMSGHRGTSFINSVLNAAYIRLSCGESLYSSTRSLHVGDDVYMACDSLATAAGVLRSMAASSCRLNPMKQSMGCYSAEFLRVAIGETRAQGYMARSIASTVSGNWVSELTLAPAEGLATMMSAARSLINRSWRCDAFELLIPSVVRMTGLQRVAIRNLLAGDVALGSGPQFRSAGTIHRLELVREGSAEENSVKRSILQKAPAHATNAYMLSVAGEVEQYVMNRLTHVTVKSAMMTASFERAWLSGKPFDDFRYSTAGNLVYPALGHMSLGDALKAEKVEGLLSSFPLCVLLRNMLSREMLRDLVELAGGDRDERDLEWVAWGADYAGCVIEGVVSYSDACAVSGRTIAGVIHTDYNCHV